MNCRWLKAFGPILLTLAFATAAEAQSYPNRPVTLVVPFAPGGLSDVPARIFAAITQERTRATFIVETKLPYKNLAELIADAKANPTKISFSTSGPATSPAIALTQLNALAATKIQDVPYRGSGEAAAAVVSGAVQGTFTFLTGAKPLVDDGKARV